MTIYLVASIHKVPKSKGLLELWASALCGPYHHVEIVFVRNRLVYACSLSPLISEFAFIEPKDYKSQQEDDLQWFHIQGISYPEELELEAKCRRMVASKSYRFSNLSLMKSIFPSSKSSVHLLKFCKRFIDPENKTNEGYWEQEGYFCATFCAEVLGIKKTVYTSTDVVELCKRELNAIEVEQPSFHTEIRICDDANIIRASTMVENKVKESISSQLDDFLV